MTQADYEGAGGNLLSFVRYYNSGRGFAPGLMGPGWSHGFDYRALVADIGGTAITLVRPDGSSAYFAKGAGNIYTGPAYLQGTLAGTFSGATLTSFVFTAADGTKEQYSANGQLNSLAYGKGGVLTFTYNGIGIASVSDNRGHTVTFSYGVAASQSRIVSVTASGSQVYTFGYDTAGRLVSVTRPDGSVRQYSYLPSYIGTSPNSLSNRLTSVVDENGAVFATIAYDANGRAISTQHGADAELTTFTYNTGSTTVTNSLGVTETMTFATTLNRPQMQTLTTACDNGCGPTGILVDQFQYDSNGNAAAITNKLGVKTCLAYDTARNLPTKVVDGLPAEADCAGAFATPPIFSRVKTYQWHATLGIPLVVTGPLLKTTFTYDSAGRKLTQSEQETSDATGASGSSAATVGAARVTTWTYNTQGSVLTVKEPRTDVNVTTTFAYDAHQNLTSITGPTGLVTTYANYDANGRSQLVTAPNGLQTTLAYNARGLPTSVTTAGAVTTYGYDAAAQLISATLRSGVSLTFTYDTAHRLIATADSLGNRVDRTLDTEGNVLQQTVTGNAGVLAYSRQAAYDQLSRTTSVSKAQ